MADSLEIEIEMEDLWMIERGFDHISETWPRLSFAIFGIETREEIQKIMEELAPFDTGAMRDSVYTEFTIDDKYHTRATGVYQAKHAQGYVDGIAPSPGRFVPGLTPRSGGQNRSGARLTAATAFSKGRLLSSIGMHPGTKAHPELFQGIEMRLNEWLDEQIEKHADKLRGDFDALVMGTRF